MELSKRAEGGTRAHAAYKGMTYYGEFNNTKIDHFMIPQGRPPHAKKHHTCAEATRILQLIEKPKDHCPLIFEIDTQTKRHPQVQWERTNRIDWDALTACLTQGKKREEYVNKVENCSRTTPLKSTRRTRHRTTAGTSLTKQ